MLVWLENSSSVSVLIAKYLGSLNAFSVIFIFTLSSECLTPNQFFFADDRSLIITNPSPIDFKKGTTAFVQLSEWINAKSLFLNYEKTHYKHFMTNSSSS